MAPVLPVVRQSPVAAGLVLGVVLDDVFGDPRRGHPVAGFGRLVSLLERRLYADCVIRGCWLVLAATVPLVAVASGLEVALRRAPLLRAGATAVATWCVLGGASLTRVAAQMGELIASDHDGAARALLPSLCGRDPQQLDTAGMTRATIESLAENTSDAVVAPLFWGAVAGVPGLLGYRAINTLDAMIGHRGARYAHFGTVAARLDDAANLVPARLTAALTLLVAPAVGGSPAAGWTAWRRDAAAHPSPNAGPCEASAAGVLGLRLGGPTAYPGRVEQRPQLGTGRAPEVGDIHRASQLSRVASHLALFACVALAIVVRRAR